MDRDNIIDDEEIDSDEAFEDGDEEAFKGKGFSFRGSSKPVVTNGRKKRPVASDFLTSSEGEEEAGAGVDESDDEDDISGLGESGSEEEEDGDEGLSDEESGDLENSEDDDEDMDSSDPDDDDRGDLRNMMKGGGDTDKENLRKLMTEGQKNVVATISQAAKEEAEKGVSVRQQRRTYDTILNLRIRLQKGLVAVNTMGVADGAEDVGKEPYEAAEEAAIKLWNAIDGFRSSLVPEAKAGQKRKRDFDVEATNEELWDEMQETEKRASAKRKQVLDKWSERVKSKTAAIAQRQIGKDTTSQNLVSVLEDQLLNSDRLVKRTHVPRSCAPVQAAKKISEDASIFDDADFYQLLLKELVDQRTTDSSAPGSSVPTVRWTAIKEAKTRKLVDRKASKGRKLRFTVHEKLQNFMAPEDRRGWEEDAIDRLFGTLFGQKNGLKEDADSDDEMGGVDVEEAGLRLFRG